jgi:4-cresol dehydrogenase (hydroxylating)
VSGKRSLKPGRGTAHAECVEAWGGAFQRAASYACFDKLVAVNAAAGFRLYRTNTAFMNKVADTYGPVQRAVNKRLKRALDPHGVLAPGKSGVHI